MRTLLTSLPLALLLVLATVAAAWGQPLRSATGRVLDVETGTPVRGAVIALPDHRVAVVTDSLGTFRLTGIPAGEQLWSIRALGYATWEERTEVDDGERLTIRLMPRPIALEAVRVRTDRLRRRRAASTRSVRALEADAILAANASGTRDLVLRNLMPMRTPCYGMPETFGDPCVLHRGQRFRARLCIDDASAHFADLDAYPREELYAIESYDHGLTIRVYTRRFMESRRWFLPLSVPCRGVI